MRRVCALLLPFFSLNFLLVAGEWRVASHLQRMCKEGRLCTSSNATWSAHTTYDKEEACAALAGRGLRNLTFAGVSQLFSCMAIHLGARSKPAPSWLKNLTVQYSQKLLDLCSLALVPALAQVVHLAMCEICD